MNEFLERIEKLSPKRLALLAYQLQSRLDKLEHKESEPIAVVGMGCRMPGGVNSPDDFWELMACGRDAVREVPADRWDIDAWYDADPDAPGTMSTRWGGFLEQVDQFDAAFFGISRREAVSMDPQQRMLMEVSWEALENAGQSPRELTGTRTGVYLGMSTGDYHSLLLNRGAEAIDAYLATGTAHSVAAGRLAYVLGLHGPNFAIDTACSSSLASAHLACLGLRAGECDVALAGGVSAVLSPDITVALSKSHMMAPDGRCKSFDARADGFVRGEGCGILVLRRLSDAISHRDRILAVIRGSAVNQDGRSSGIAAPNGASQEAVIRQALANAGVRPSDIGYIETHGTGTSLGDPIEAHALAAVFGPGRTAGHPLVLGSVKTNIGHLEAAAGAAGLIKAVLALRHAYLPPHLHFTNWNPHIMWNGMPVEVPVGGRDWPAGERKRLAGVSSFGFSGTNVHMVVQEAPVAVRRATGAERPMHVLALSARSRQGLESLKQSYAEHLTGGSEAMGDIAFTANAGRSHFEHRATFVASSLEEWRTQLQAPLRDKAAEKRREVVFLFSGQGAQYVGMGRELYESQPVFRAALEKCEGLLRRELEEPLLEVLYGGAGERLKQTAYTQPALFAIEYALAELWKSWGIEPSAVLGHSVGEYAAACVAGMCSLEEGLVLIAERGRRMQALPGAGAMAAVLAGETEVRQALAGWEGQVSVAAVNAPGNVVISGERRAVEAVSQGLRGRDVRVQELAVSHAFHSAQMEPMAEEFARRAAGIGYRAGRVPLISSVTGERVGGEELREPGYWRRQVREAVQFRMAMEGLGEGGHRVFVEIGPGTTLLGLGRQCLEGKGGVWLASLRRGESDWRQMLNSLGELYEQGAEVDWAGFDQPYDRRRISLPTYPFERQRYWLDAQPPATRVRRAGNLQHPFLTSRVPAAIPIYEGLLNAAACPFLADHRVGGTAILPASAYIELALAAAAETAGVPTGVIHELSILEPVRLAERPHQVQVVLTPSLEDGAGFQIFARPDAGEAEAGWTLHATGRLGRGGNTAPSKAEPLPFVYSEVPPEKFYELLRSREFDLGPACRVIRALRCGPGHAVAQVEIEASISGDSASYQAHPALVDGWFQALGAALAFGDSRSGAPSYVLARVGDFRLYERPTGLLTAHATVFPEGSSEAMVGRLAVLDAAGKLVAEAGGISLRLIESSGETAPDDWFYRVEWQPSGKASETAVRLVAARELAQGLEPVAAALGARKWNDRYDLLRARLDSIVALHIVDALRQLGLPLRPGDDIPEARLAGCGVLDRHRSLLARMLEILCEDAVLESGDGTWKVLRSPECGSLPFLWEAVVREFPEFSAELDLTSRCASELAKVLQGKTDPLHLLFPDGSSAALERLYTESPVARMMNELVGRAVSAAVAGLAADRPLRVLEIGAGTGSSTRCIAPLLPAGRTQYAFTDVSPLFLDRAREMLSAYPYIEYKLLDIENNPADQGFEDSQFDVVVAANVLHATADLRRTVTNAARLLAPGGLLIALEGTRPERWVDLTFGMTEGWWKYSDRDLRPEYPLLSSNKWLRLLNELGFSDASAVEPVPGANQVLLLGRAPVRQARSGHWLLVGNASSLAASIAARVEQFGGSAKIATPAESTAALLEHYDHVVDLTNTAAPPVEATAGNTCFEVVRLVQRLLAKSRGRPSSLWLVTRGAQPLRAARPIAMEQASVWGVARTVGLEHPALWGGVLDLDPEDSADQCAACVVDSVLGAGGSENQTAFRSGSCYVPRLVRSAPPPARSYQFLPDAAYLITGGHGSLGLSVARWMAENGARKLVLAGRSAPGDWHSMEPPSGSRRRRARAIQDIEALGATVHAITLDVAEPGQLRRLDGILAPGELRGIVHAAAVFDSSPLADMTPEAFASVMRPKVEGTWRLHEWSKSQKLDFFVMFSSTTALLGSRNLAHYAAANQFLDALAYCRAAEGLPALAINWGTWDEMGETLEETRRAYRQSGLHPMRSGLALNALGRLLCSPATQAVVAEIDWGVLRGFYEARRRMPFLSRLATAPGKATVAAPAAAEKSDVAAAVAGALPGDRLEIVTAFVRGHAAAVLGLRPDEVDVKAGLFEIGMDSLMSVELKGRLQKGVGMPLPSTLTFNYPTVVALSSYLLEKFGPGLAPTEVRDQPPPRVPSVENDQPSEDELAAMLADALRKL